MEYLQLVEFFQPAYRPNRDPPYLLLVKLLLAFLKLGNLLEQITIVSEIHNDE